MQFVGTQPLTLANLCLSQFEAKDTSRVEAFVRSQRLHSYTFASEGRAFDESQQRKRSCEVCGEASIAPPARYQGIGFSSPILKARADMSQDTAAGIPANEPSNASEDYCKRGKNNKKVNTSRKRDVSIRCSGKVTNKPPMAKSRSSRKASSSHNMENTARLAVRRDRKRAKRAIVDPVYASETTKDENLGEGAKDGKRYRGTRAKKQAKIGSQLTLMQSFLATNIGKERLTLKPGLNMGVFNKGKASVSMSMNDKERRAKNDHTFSETEFLNTDKLLHLGSSSQSSCASNDAQATREPIKFSKFFIKTSRAEHMTTEKRRNGSEKSLSTTKHIYKSPDIQVEAFDDGGRSEIWDIELEKSLPSDDRSLSIQDQKMQSIILNAHIKKPEIDPHTDINPLQIQPSSRDCSLPRDISPIRGQSSNLQPGNPLFPTYTHSASQMDKLSQHDLDLVESATQQRQTDETASKRLPISHTLSFQFRPVKSTNKVFKFPAKSFAFNPFEVDDNDAQTQLNISILSREDTNDKRITSEACQWNMNVPEHAEQDSRGLLTAANFNEYALDGMEDYCCQDESNPELKPPPEHYLPEMCETTTDLTQQNELNNCEIYLGDYGAPETLSDREQECHGSLQAEEWSHILVDDDYEDLSTDALMSQSVKDWPDLDCKVASIPELYRYIQDGRGSDTTTSDFIQGRSVLFGIEEPIVHNGGLSLGLKGVEHEVATQLLKNHWLPQKL